jgi:transcriptional regulator with XRE-family HTH domain
MRYNWPDIAHRIREARVAAKLTQTQLSAKADVGSRTIPTYEAGEGAKLPTSPDLEVIERIASTCGTTAAWILYGVGQKPVAESTVETDLYTSEELEKMAIVAGGSPITNAEIKRIMSVNFHRADWRKVAELVKAWREIESS